MDFSTRISRLTGINPDLILSSWLTESAREILMLLPEERAASAAKMITFPYSSSSSKSLYGNHPFEESTANINYVRFSSVPSYPNNKISEMLGNIEPYIESIVGEGMAATQMSPGLWVGNFTKFESNVDNINPYYLICREDVVWNLNHEDAIFEEGVGSLTTTIDVENYRILNVTRSDGNFDLPCRKIMPSEKGKAQKDSGYFQEVTDTDPCYYIENNQLTVLPAPADGNNAKISAVLHPEINKGDTFINNFPIEFEHLVLLGACKKAKMHQIGEANKEEDIEIATSHLNQLNSINQEYITSLQTVMTGNAQSNQIQESGQ